MKQTPPVGTVRRSCEFHWHGRMARHVAPLEVERIQQSTRTGTGIANNTCYRIVPASLHFTFPAFTCRQQAASEQAGRQAERQTGRQDTSRTCSCHTDADIPRSLQVDFLATGGQHHHHLHSHLTLLSLLFLVAVVAVVSWCRGVVVIVVVVVAVVLVLLQWWWWLLLLLFSPRRCRLRSVAPQSININKQDSRRLASPPAVLSFPPAAPSWIPPSAHSIIFIDSDYPSARASFPLSISIPTPGQLESSRTTWIEGEQHR